MVIGFEGIERLFYEFLIEKVILTSINCELNE